MYNQKLRWWADDGPLLVLYGSSVLPSSTKINKKIKENLVSVGNPLTKLSESENVQFPTCDFIDYFQNSLNIYVLGIVKTIKYGQSDCNYLENEHGTCLVLTGSYLINKIFKNHIGCLAFSFPAVTCHLMIAFANSLDPGQDQQTSVLIWIQTV